MNTRKPVQPPAPGGSAQAFSFEERGLLHAGQLSQLVVDLGVVKDAAELLRADAQRIDVDHRAGVGIGGVVHAGLVVDGVADGHAEGDVGAVQLIILLAHLLLGGSADFQRPLVGLAQILHLVVGQQQLACTGSIGVGGQGQAEVCLHVGHGGLEGSLVGDAVLHIGGVELGVGHLLVGEVGTLFEIKNGLNKGKEAFGKGTPIINFTDVYNHRYLNHNFIKGLVDVTDDEIKRYSAKKGDVFFTRTSETKEDIGMSSTLIEDIPDCVFSGFVLRARPITDYLLPKFCSYYFSTTAVRNVIIRYASVTTRATTTGPKLSKIMVPILPIEEQERIVSILDRFDKLCNDLSTGLPAEIEARQKQYEYYRDKLLTFKEKQ